MVMGVAQCSSDRRWTRLLYIVSFFLIQVYTTPWLSLMARIIRRGLSLI
jgi:hypothetical protein